MGETDTSLILLFTGELSLFIYVGWQHGALSFVPTQKKKEILSTVYAKVRESSPPFRVHVSYTSVMKSKGIVTTPREKTATLMLLLTSFHTKQDRETPKNEQSKYTKMVFKPLTSNSNNKSLTRECS